MNARTMTDAGFDPRTTGRVAIAIPVVGIAAFTALALLYASLPVFGPINDLLNAVGGALTAVLAWRLLPLVRGAAPGIALVLVGAAWIGSASVIGNSLLVAVGQLDWMTGGLYTALGYGLHGIWLTGTILLARRAGTASILGTRAVPLGIAAGIGSLFGLIAAVNLVTGQGLFANPLIWVSFAGWLLYAIWCWIVGRRLEAAGREARASA